VSNRFHGWRLVYRFPLMLAHLLLGLPLTVISFLPAIRGFKIRGRGLSEVMQCWWAATSCRIFGLRRKVHGSFLPGPLLIAANHISWIDILVLHGISPMGFVAKAEIESWPLAGWLARIGDTVFHRRGSHDSASSVVEVMTRRLQEGRKVAIFAEGGILPGNGVKRFHARLFAAAINSGKPVQPVMLRYFLDGQPYHEITFGRNESFPGNIFRLLRQPACTAEVQILPAVLPQGKQRRELAGEAQAAVETAFESEPLS